jgi:2-polyprenyl-6-methoxyphenol hydroxylase-like FAD-dependent oxidoreductase
MLLARLGHRVLLVDRATFPSDIPRLHLVRQPGIALLARWGLLNQVAASNCPPINWMTLDYGDVTLSGWGPPADGVAESYGPRRAVLDQILVQAAVAAGVELRESFAVQDLLWDGDRVVGVRGQGKGGASLAEGAKLVIGADGLHSCVARAVAAPVYQAQPTLCCYYASYFSGVPLAGIEVYVRDGQAIFVFPTNDDLTCIAIAWPRSAFDRVRAEVEASFFQALERAPGLAERVRAGRREHPFIGSADLPNFFRRPFGPGWALVGDAGHHKDPYVAHGISDALRDADRLASAVDDGLRGRRPLEAALAEHEQSRNEALMPIYTLNCRLAALAPAPPEQQRLRAALVGNQADTNRFLGVTAGTVPVQEFFAPDNVGRILAQAAPAPAAR